MRVVFKRFEVHIHPAQEPGLGLTIGPDINIERTSMVSKQVFTQQAFTLSLTPKSGAKPARIDGVPEYSVSDPNVLSIEPSADGLSARVKSGDKTGTATVTVSADADLGSGVRTITDSIEVEVRDREADSLGLSAGDAEDL